LTRFLPRAAGAVLAAALAFAWTGPAFAISVARDTEIEEFLWHEARPIFVAAGLDPNAVTIYLVSDPSFNAFVSGGQNMFIFTGLIDQVEKPDQLLGVIAHETGHMAGGHLSRSGDDVTAEAAPFLITMLAGLAAMLAGAGQAGMGIILGAQHAMQRAILGYSRVQEASADQAAITYLDTIHRSGEGMLETFELLGQQELLTANMQDPYARSHPMSSDRIAFLEDRVSKSPYRDNRDSPEDIARFKLIQGKVRGFMDDPQTTLRRYPPSDTSGEARYARAVAYYRAAEFGSANREIDSLIAEAGDNPYFWELKGQILAEARDFRAAAQAFEKSVALKPKAPLLQVNLGATLVALEDPKLLPEARDTLEDALRRDPTNAFAWLQLSFAYDHLGNEGMAALAMAEQRFNMGEYGDAIRFAARAKKLLPAGSREANRADDIIVIAEAQEPDEDDRGGRGRLSIETNLTEK
jgi:predicted Zn-dependent protease